MSEVHTLVLTRYTQRYLRGTQNGSGQDNVIEANMRDILKGVNNKSWAVQGWEIAENAVGHGDDTNMSGRTWSRFEVDHEGETTDEKGMPLGAAIKHRFEMYLKVTYSRDKQPESLMFPRICNKVYTVAKQHVVGDWYLTQVDGNKYHPAADDPTLSISGDEYVEYMEPTMPDDWKEAFDHLYGLDPQIMKAYLAIMEAIESGFENRFNIVMIGPPGCGKTEVCRTFKRLMGEDAVLEFDATATTGAGAIKELAEREILPRIIISEEIEKSDDKATNFMLSVLDQRGEIRKTTARATIVRDTKVFGIATVNNEALFNKMAAGALASRFMTPIYFKRPSEDILTAILKREIAKRDGDEAWIVPTLDYCRTARNRDGTIGITDPRQVIAICMSGKDMLLSGEYQQILADTTPGPEEAIYDAAIFEDTVVEWDDAVAYRGRHSSEENGE